MYLRVVKCTPGRGEGGTLRNTSECSMGKSSEKSDGEREIASISGHEQDGEGGLWKNKNSRKQQ